MVLPPRVLDEDGELWCKDLYDRLNEEHGLEARVPQQVFRKSLMPCVASLFLVVYGWRMRWHLRFMIVILGWSIVGFQPGMAQEASTAKSKSPAAKSIKSEPTPGEQVEVLLQGMQAVVRDRAALRELEKKLEGMRSGSGQTAKASAEEIEAMQKDVDAARISLAKHEDEVREAILGVTGLSEEEGEPTDLSKDVKDVMQPLLRSAKDLVANQRRAAEVQDKMSRKQRSLEKHAEAMINLERVKEAVAAKSNTKELKDWLVAERRKLENTRAHLAVELGNLQREFDDLESGRKPWSEYATTILRDSVLRRVLNLILSGLAVVAVLLASRMVHRFFSRRGYLQRLGVSVFFIRLLNVFYYMCSALAAGLAAFLVLYATNDWFLLTLAMLGLAGLLLAGRHTLPKLYEQVKLLLNLGSAREGERVIFRELPWLIKRLNFYCDLVNPSLTGGTLRLTMRDVIPLNSRPFDRKERWFPTEEGDWVMLNDGMLGKVVLQTPEYVQVVPNGGSYKTYPIAEFLRQNPRNLSHNFRLQSLFGVDYKHAEQVREEIPPKIADAVRSEFLQVITAEEILHLNVSVAQANTSSLDLLVLVDLKGSVAARYQELERLIQRGCVSAAVENHWEIPFPQLQIHETRHDA